MKKIILTSLLGMAAALTLSSCATTTDASASQSNGSTMWIMLIVYGAIIAGIYFLLIRPNSKKKKEEQKLRDSVDIGDEITTIGGIMGRVVSVKEETDSIVIETGADRTKMQIKKWAISTIDSDKELPDEKSDKKKDKKDSKKSKDNNPKEKK